MSADMFPRTPHQKHDSSRIPIPSPTPLRRHGSLRLRGEKDPLYLQKTPARVISRTTNHTSGFQQDCVQSKQTGVLKRGNSFMERGERRSGHGVRPTNVASRPQNFKIESRNNAALKGATTPQSPSRIRSLSLSLSNTKLSSPRSPGLNPSPSSPNPPLQDGRHQTEYSDWDSESVTSIASVASCDHASVARNGTTFSGRSMKYVFHCNQHAGATGEDYLTPTQRAHRQVKKLKSLLHQAKKDLEQKDSDIVRLTKEVVELRLYKAALSSPEDKSNSSDAVTVRENTSEETTPEADLVDNRVPNHTGDLTNSFADSGHFEDCTNSSVHSKDSVLFDDIHRSPCKSKQVETAEVGVTAHFGIASHESEHSRLIMEYERRLQELVRTHEEESYQLKQKHNDKVEELLQRITEINTRYWELVPELESARERIKELEIQLEEAGKKLEQQEDKQKQTYLAMYEQGHEAARLEQENRVMEIATQNPNRVSVPQLLQELQVTKNELENLKAMYRQLMEAKSKNKIDPEITLQFLKSAIYYFLTDKENSQGHLKAIESILGFSSNEITNIDRARYS